MTSKGNELNGKELVEALLLGSIEIDRMKSKTDKLVRMITGLVILGLKDNYPEWFQPKHEGMVKFTSSACFWKFSLFLGQREGQSYWVVECYLPIPGTCGGWRSAYSTNWHRPTSFEEVMAVNEGLSVLVDGMTKTFPFLAKYMQPFLDAAVAAKQRG